MAGRFWREHGEKSPGFLKRSTVSRENRRSIVEVRDPATDDLCQDQESIANIATDFYTTLFTPDAIDRTALSVMIRNIPSHLKITSREQEFLMMPINVEKLLASTHRHRVLQALF